MNEIIEMLNNDINNYDILINNAKNDSRLKINLICKKSALIDFRNKIINTVKLNIDANIKREDMLNDYLLLNKPINTLLELENILYYLDNNFFNNALTTKSDSIKYNFYLGESNAFNIALKLVENFERNNRK